MVFSDGEIHGQLGRVRIATDASASFFCGREPKKAPLSRLVERRLAYPIRRDEEHEGVIQIDLDVAI